MSPYNEEYRTPPQANRQYTPFDTSPNPLQRKSFTTTPYRSIRFSDYRSPYANRAQKFEPERKPPNDHFPVISNNRAYPKGKLPVREPRYRSGRQNQPVATKSPAVRTILIFSF